MVFHSRFKTLSQSARLWQVDKWSGPPQLRNHIIAVPPGKICSQTSVVI